MEHVAFDVIVIGSGAAGFRAALSARTAGLSVGVVSKGNPGKSTCTGFSAGVMAGGASGDQRDTHLQRILTYILKDDQSPSPQQERMEHDELFGINCLNTTFKIQHN
jgi:succinate dehydrogenase/fumarate reductase flavoprotein subunit